MTFSKSDFPLIKWSLFIFLSVLVVGGTAMMASENFLTRVAAERLTAQRQLNEARKLLATALEDRENMKTYTTEYGYLLNRNIIGSDQRLDWIEGLDRLRNQNHVLDVKYAISPQQAYSPAPPVDSGNFELGLSPMTMQFDLLHEVQLINFLDVLRREIKGWYILDHCSIERNSMKSDKSTALNSAARLKAECAGGWLTLTNRNTK